jgi:hypothetical protein
MGIKQVEQLYRKMIKPDENSCREINPDVRADIFQKIMDDVERLMKKMRHYKLGSSKYAELDSEIRGLLLKEIQVIMDDYYVAKTNGTMQQWEEMYGDINHYINKFHSYRNGFVSKSGNAVSDNYGFFNSEEQVG